MSQRLRTARARRRRRSRVPMCARCQRPMRRIWVPDLTFIDSMYPGAHVWGCDCYPDGSFWR